jgi:hypothetical protein
MVEVTSNYTVALILTLMTVLLLGGCVYKIYKPNCDPVSLDHFKEFVDKFERCSLDENNCEDYVYENLPERDKIILENVGKTTNVGLWCKGNKGEDKTFENVGLCETSPITGRLIGEVDFIEITNDEDHYGLDGKIKFENKEGNVCLVVKSLGTGFVDSPD